MAGDSDIVVTISADASDIQDKLKAIGANLSNLGAIADDGLAGMLSKFNPLELGWAGVGVAVAAVTLAITKAAYELALMGERIEQVENGFLKAAANAGIAGEELKAAMLKASDGVLDVNDLLQRSSQLIVALGKGAEKLPEVIGLAREVAKTYGIDSQTAFDQISESIRNGNTRMLKHYGILIDSEAAVRKFADANGVAANSLSEQGRAQAILNDVLLKGRQAFGDASQQTKSLGESADAMKVSFHDAFEALATQIYNRLGPAFTFIVGAMAQMAQSAATMLAPSSLAQQVTEAEAELNRLSKRLIETQRIASALNPFGMSGLVSVDGAQAKFDAAKKQLMDLRKLKEEADAKTKTTGGDSAAVVGDITDKQKLKQNEIKFQTELATIRLQAAQAQIANASSAEELAQAQKDRLLDLEIQYRAKIAEIDHNDMLTGEQRDALKVQQHALHLQQLRALDETVRQEKLAQDQMALQNANSFNAGIAAAAEQAADKAADAWRKSGGLAGSAVGAFSNRTIAAFTAIGNGSKSAGDALKQAFFGMLGDMASAYGQFMFLASLFPPNPVGLAGGLALIALGGLLSSMGGGSSSTAGSSASGGGGGGYDSMAATTPAATTASSNKAVTINIEGNYFDSEQTRLSIVEAVRSASDANDYTVQRGNRY